MPATRWSVVVCCAAVVMVGCGQQSASAPVIGVRSQNAAAAGAGTFDVSPIAAEFAAELAADTNVQAIGEDKLAAGELPIDSVLTLRQSERLANEQLLGSKLVSQRLNDIAKVRAQVNADPAISYSQRSYTLGLLDTSAAAVAQMGVTIARDQLVDQAHIDVRRLAALRVDGLVLPLARKLVAAYDLARLAASYASQHDSLQQQIYTAEAFGKDASASQGYVNDLARQVAAMNRASANALADVQGLTPAGYPANKPAMNSARLALAGGQAAADQAAYDAGRARALLPH
jgi:hypothetical protein